MTNQNAVVWFEIPAVDFDRAVRFYETVLGVSLIHEHTGDGPRMANFPYGEGGAGGGVSEARPGLEPSQGGVVIYLHAGPDLAPALSRVEPAGGRVTMAKTLISPEIGCIAKFIDTEGNQVALHSVN